MTDNTVLDVTAGHNNQPKILLTAPDGAQAEICHLYSSDLA